MVGFGAYLIYKGAAQSQDFGVFHTAGRRILSGDIEVYKFSDGANPYKYWPGFAYLMIPLSALPFAVARTVWAAVNLGGLFLAMGLVLRGLAPRTNWFVVGAWSMALIGQALTNHFMDGQINLMVLAAMLMGFHLIGRERSWRAFGGVALIVAAAGVKLFPLLVMLLFVVKKEWRLLGYAAVTVAVFAVIPFLIAGTETGLHLYGMWWAILRDSGNHLDLAIIFNQSLLGMFLRLTGSPALAGTLHKVASLLLVGVLAWGISKGPLRGIDRTFVFDFTMVACGMLLISPLTWTHYYVFLLPITILIVGEFADAGSRSRQTWIGLALLLIIVIPTEMTTGRVIRDWFMAASNHVIEALLILGYVIVRQRQDAMSRPSPAPADHS